MCWEKGVRWVPERLTCSAPQGDQLHRQRRGRRTTVDWENTGPHSCEHGEQLVLVLVYNTIVAGGRTKWGWQGLQTGSVLYKGAPSALQRRLRGHSNWVGVAWRAIARGAGWLPGPLLQLARPRATMVAVLR